MNLDELEIFLGAQDNSLRASAQESPRPGFDSTAAAVKLVPRPVDPDPLPVTETLPAATLQERLQEIEMAQRLGYLLCKCTWPPQIMVLTGTDHVYRCRRCSRVREM